ncbi:MAG: hypothetical protein BZ138_02150 [Methanosphaera sp. rholeuAM270]|nr:MAG: hypothetical protein BZ138_02150 [Methanosphaera sp. rholeuAM270]
MTMSLVSAQESLNNTQLSEDSCLHDNIEKVTDKTINKNIEHYDSLEDSTAASTDKKVKASSNTTRANTRITVKRSMRAIYVGEVISFTGNVKSNTSLTGNRVYLMENGTTILSTTINASSSYNLSYKVPTPGLHLMNVSFRGNDYCEPASISVEYTGVQRKTSLSTSHMSGYLAGTPITITGQLSHQSKLLSNQNIEIHLNNKVVNTRTNADGRYNCTLTENNAGSYNVDIYYRGTNVYQASESHTTLNVVKITPYLSLNLNSIYYYGDVARITGRLYASGYTFSNAKLRLTIDDKTMNIYTDDEGFYSYNYKVSAIKNYVVTVSYTGNASYYPASNTQYFEGIKHDTKIVLYRLRNVVYNEVISIGGQLTSEGNVLKNTKIKLSINNNIFNLTTDSSGMFNYDYRVKSVQVNTVKATYSGNLKYASSYDTAQFDSTKRATSLKIDWIAKKVYGNKIQISGSLSSLNAPLKTRIMINFNNKNISATTDSEGYYNVTQKVTTVGTNNVTVIYNGNQYFKASKNSRTFEVVKMQSRIKSNAIPAVYYSAKTNITGKLVDIHSNPLVNTRIIIKVNNNVYTTNTSVKGDYKLSVKATKVGKNTVTVSYNGNGNYEPYSINSSFMVSKMPVKLTLNQVSVKIYGKNAVISGKLLDYNNNTIKNQGVIVQLNNKNVTVKTDSNGIYKYSFKASKLGKNIVNVTFSNKNYRIDTHYRTFYVKKLTTIVVNRIADQKFGNTIKLSGKLLSGNKALSNALITVSINGEELLTRTSSTGYFFITYSVYIYDDHTIGYHYAGNSIYFNSSNVTTFKVKG